MKKIFAALGALVILGVLAVACKKKEIVQGDVELLSVEPTEISIPQGDTKTFSLTSGDIIVNLKPVTASYTIESSDETTVSVSGKAIKGVKKGVATITVKAGDKTATVKVTVTDKATFDQALYMNDVYVPKNLRAMKPLKAEIVQAMEAKGWVNEVIFDEDKNQQQAFQFVTTKQKSFNSVAFFHSPTQGDNFIAMYAMYAVGSWKKEGFRKSLLEAYQFTSNYEEDHFADGRPLSAAYNIERGIFILLYFNGVKTNDKGEKFEDIVAEIKIGTPETQSANIQALATGYNFNPLTHPVRIF